jgi:hypothetical protein
MMQAPVTVLQTNTKRDTGKKAQYGNIMAGKVGGRGIRPHGAAPCAGQTPSPPPAAAACCRCQ